MVTSRRGLKFDLLAKASRQHKRHADRAYPPRQRRQML